MTLEHHPITTSSVILLNSSHTPPNPPPSPPSPATPCERSLSPPLDDLLPISPPDNASSPNFDQRLATAVHVLGTEATALSCLTRLYETDPIARDGFNEAVNAITRTKTVKGKVILAGVGKSGYISRKMEATLKSLNIPASFLHATEGLHGDLGNITPENDTIIFISYSGSTKEMLTLLDHIPPMPLIVITGHTHGSTCEIVRKRPETMLLPAPVHISETESFGVNAPTTSTTMALALCDALALVTANQIHEDVGAVFSRFHPGGAIGAASKGPRRISEFTINFSDISTVENVAATGANILMAAYRSETRWLKQGDVLMPPTRIEQIQPEYLDDPASCIRGLMVPQKDWVEIPDTMDIVQAKEWILSRQCTGEKNYRDDGVLVTMDDDEVTGVMEIGELMKVF